MTEILKPTPEGKTAAEQALAAIKDRTFSGRHPELGRMINCQFCGLRHRENDNGRDKPCEQHFFTTKKKVLQIAGTTPSTSPELLYDGDIPRKQTRILNGARPVKGKRKTPRNKRQRPLTRWQRILIAKAKKNAQETN